MEIEGIELNEEQKAAIEAQLQGHGRAAGRWSSRVKTISSWLRRRPSSARPSRLKQLARQQAEEKAKAENDYKQLFEAQKSEAE